MAKNGVLLLVFGLAAIISSHNVSAEPWARHTIDDSSRGADGVRVADVNGDDRLDLVTGWEEGGVIRAYLNPGSKRAKRLWPAVTVGSVKSPEDAVFADLDHDGAVDVVSCCEGGTRTVFVHWAPKSTSDFQDPSSWKTEAIPCTEKKQMWMFCLPMQIDGRHGIDLIVGSKGSGATIGWLQSPSNPRDVSSWKFHSLYNAGWIMSLQAHDMDGDGDTDVLASDRKGKTRGVLWLENPGAKAAASGARWQEHRVDAGDREVMFLTVGDLDKDGLADIVCTVRGRGISVLRQTKVQNEWRFHEVAMPPGYGTGKGVAICDVDSNGKNDIIFSCENAKGDLSGVAWLSYKKSAEESNWQHHNISGSRGVKFDRIELLDLDEDGDLDVITCEERDNLGVVWYENPGGM